MAVDLSFFQSETARMLRAEGRDEGRIEGRAEDVLRLLQERGVEVSQADRERVTDCRDLGTLDVWFTRAITAGSTAEVFADRLV